MTNHRASCNAGIDLEKLANSILIKLNQIGSVRQKRSTAIRMAAKVLAYGRCDLSSLGRDGEDASSSRTWQLR